MKTSFIATVFNEEKNILSFIKSILTQSKKPDEIIIVDGGSIDETVEKIKNRKLKIKNKEIKFKILIKKGNRSVGRNEAINKASNDIIVCSDAGCILDKNWIKNIVKPFNNSKVDVVAGYYSSKSENVFQKCLTPYVLVMKNKVNSTEFLPATRSMAFKKTIWKKIGGFDEQYSHNEDYVFAHKLKKLRANIVFERKAIVNWIPRSNLKDAFKMFFRFALGDSESGILREKVLFLFARYILGFYLLLLSIIEKSTALLSIVGLILLAYIIWSVKKNYKYVKDIRAFIFLPLLQFTSDIAVITGTSIGLLKRIRFKDVRKIIRNNKGIVLIIGLYALCMFFLINWGIPGKNHPFDYFMDEWHQSQAVRAVFTQGSPNIPGSANGSMFHFLLSGLLLVPFAVVGIVNPFVIKSSLGAFEMQQRLFQVFRLNTLFFGIISIILIVYIAKKYFKLNPFLATFLFVVNPIWITLSNYFKYDIALIFWIILSLLSILRYSEKSSVLNFSLAAFFCGLAFSVKVSVFPLLPILFISYFIFAKNRRDTLKYLIVGISIFFLTFLIFGIPDLLLGKGNITEYLYDNLIRTPNYVSNYIFGKNYISYLLFNGASTIFGYSLFFLSNVALIFSVVYLLKNNFKEPMGKRYLLIVISLLIFIVSLLFLKIEARGNRLLVLLPFMVLLSGIFVDKILKLTKGFLKKVIVFILVVFLIFQTVETFSWVSLKLKSDLRQSSSIWIAQNIPLRSNIGIENIPIYQFLPDILLKDYYLSVHHISKSTYSYKIINNQSMKLPVYVIVTNEEVAKNYMIKSSKRDLIQALGKDNYKKIYHQELELGSLNLLRSKLDYFMSGLIQEPLSISIYEKQNATLSKIIE